MLKIILIYQNYGFKALFALKIGLLLHFLIFFVKKITKKLLHIKIFVYFCAIPVTLQLRYFKNSINTLIDF